MRALLVFGWIMLLYGENIVPEARAPFHVYQKQWDCIEAIADKHIEKPRGKGFVFCVPGTETGVLQ